MIMIFLKEVRKLKKQTTIRLTKAADEWLSQQAKQRGISRNDVLQELINKAMKKKIA
jgi:predicted HicB family RNase H-like nuclease